MKNNYENERINKASIFDEIALMKREQTIIKRSFTNKFLFKLEEIIEKCFLKPKERKEGFVTKEKLTLELLYLLQAQKKFKDSELIHNELCSLAVFDLESNLIGRICSINLDDKTVEFLTLSSVRDNKPGEIKKFDKVDFFDAYSLKMEKYYALQKNIYDCFNHRQTFDLITGKLNKGDEIECKKDPINYSLGRGVPLDKNLQERINNRDLND